MSSVSFIGDYTILGQIGVGTFASVYKCVKADSKPVCIKVLNYGNQTEKKIAHEEILALETLKGRSNVVQLVEWFPLNDNAHVALVTENMDCGDLSNVLADPSIRLDLSHVKCILKQVLTGLESMTQANFMHRDLKVPNVLLNRLGHVKLGDLGTATSFTARNTFSTTVCTLWYRAPELLMGVRNYDHKIDVWSAACVFIELVTKRNFLRCASEEQQLDEIVKFFGLTEQELAALAPSLAPALVERLAKATESPATGLEYLRKALPASGFDLIMSMFRINPKDRKSASELLAHKFFSEAPLPCNPALLPAVDGLDCFQLSLQRQHQAKLPKPIMRRFSPSSRSSSPSSPRHVTFDLPIRTVFFDKEEAPITVGVSQVQLSPPPSTKKRARDEPENWSEDEDYDDDEMAVDNAPAVRNSRSWALPAAKRPKLSEDGLLDSSSSTQSSSSPSSRPSTPTLASTAPVRSPSAAANPYLAPIRRAAQPTLAALTGPVAPLVEVIPVHFAAVAL